jgi:hypothetical protein
MGSIRRWYDDVTVSVCDIVIPMWIARVRILIPLWCGKYALVCLRVTISHGPLSGSPQQRGCNSQNR